ncbi:hypothetical protein JCM3770_001459 [Rhodotorula araucariae]
MTDVSFRGYDAVQHGWSNAMLDDVADWFAEKVPQVRATLGSVANKTDGGSPPQEDAVAPRRGAGARGTASRLSRRRRTAAAVFADAARYFHEVF